MGYSVPPKVAVQSGALIVGLTAVAVLAAPGAGLAYRLYSISVGVNRTLAAAVVDADVIETTTGTFLERFTAMSAAGGAWLQSVYPFPGYQLTPNNGLTVNFNSTVAAGSGLVCVKYYLDSVS